ncbi:MAG: MarR family transcriptional regulator [Candidatus Lokiarchaeota archaeon]|nr:MarR family transcriptional regulator [Candidatus Lokiarchaeota archaeon]
MLHIATIADHIHILSRIRKLDLPLVSSIANSLYISRSKTSRLISELVKRGYIERKYDNLVEIAMNCELYHFSKDCFLYFLDRSP